MNARSKKRRLLKAGLLAVMCIVALGVTAAYAAITTQDVNIDGENDTVGGKVFYTNDIKISCNVQSDDSELKQAILYLNGVQVSSKNLDTSAEDVEFEVKAEKLAEIEPANYSYTAKIKCIDVNGQEAAIEKEFYADASVPDIKIQDVADNKAYNEDKTPKITMSDQNINNDSAALKITKDGLTVVNKDTVDECKKFDSYTASGEGDYTIETQLAGKAQSSKKSVSFIIDKTAPVVSAVDFSGDKAEGFDWFKSDVTAGSTVTDALAGISAVNVYLNDEKVGSAQNAAGDKYQYTFAKAELKTHDKYNGKYTVRFEAEDKAGNKTVKENVFYASVTDPVCELTGVKEGSFVNEAPDINAKADNSETVQTVSMIIMKDAKEYKELSGAQSVHFTPAEDGYYEISASVVDKAGNTSKIETLTFTYDTASPELVQTGISGDLRDSYSWFYNTVMLNIKAADDLAGLKKASVSVNDSTVISFTDLKGEKETASAKELDNAWFKANASEDGKYNVVFSAVDRAGNSAQVVKVFYADVVTPKVSISGINNGEHTNKTPDIEATVSDNYPSENTIVFTVIRDGKGYASKSVSGMSGHFNSFTKDGKYIVKVYSVDKAGNISDIKQLSFVKDTVAPVISISGAKQGSYTRGAKTLIAAVKDLNYSGVTVGGNITRTLDGKTTNIGWGKITPDKLNFRYTKKVNGTGTYEVTLTARDKAGNAASPKKLVFTIDNDKPVVKITGVKTLNGYSDVVTPKVSWEDSYFKSKKVSITRASGKTTEGIGGKEKTTKKGGTKVYSNFAKQKIYDDIYTITCVCTDKAGNSTSESKTFTVCRFGSDYIVSKASRKINGTYMKDIDETVYIREINPAGFSKAKGYVVCDGVRTDGQAKVTSGTYKGWASRVYAFPASLFSKEGIYELDTSSVDKTGNSSSFIEDKNSLSFTIDKTPPVITVSGVEDGGRYNLNDAKAVINVNDAIKMGSFTADSNGQRLYSSATEKVCPAEKTVQLKSGTHIGLTVKATDAAGNTAEYEVDNLTVSDSFLVRALANKDLVIAVLAVLAAIAVAVFVSWRRKKHPKSA